MKTFLWKMKTVLWMSCLLVVGAACRRNADVPTPYPSRQQPQSQARTPAAALQSQAQPSRTSQAPTVQGAASPNTWHGIGLRQVPDCERCCGLVFPDRFGARHDDELALLKEIAMGEGRAPEIGCHFHYAKQALAQLRKIAIADQSAGAASIILHAGSEGGVDLGGGEVAETFGAEYLAPVLESPTDLKGLLEPTMEQEVAERLCGSAYSMVPGQSVDVDRIVASLRRRGLTGLSRKIQTTCATIARGVKR
jgi:hypothetical protein